MQRAKYDIRFKNNVISLYYNAEKPEIEIAKTLNINKSLVSKWIKKFAETGDLENKKLGGRPRKTSNRDDIQIRTLIKRNPFMSSKEVLETLRLNVDSSTIRRRAIEAGLKSYTAVKKPLLSKKHARKRLQFAKRHVNWSVTKWKTVLFSDESKFNLLNSDGITRVRRPKGKRLDPRFCKKTVKFGGGSVMVWTCFSGHGLGPFHKIDGIMDRFVYKDILETKMLPYAEWKMPLRWVFQHDNDPKHTSKHVKEWLTSNKIQVLDWPAQSPDLNPIENLFSILKRRVGTNRFETKELLFETLKNEWEKINSTVITNLIKSMPKRCRAVIKNKGYYTKY